jgi:hypothetical protein
MATFIDVMHSSVPQKCLVTQETNWMSFIISLGLAVGIVGSYLPQAVIVVCQANTSTTGLFKGKAVRE